MREEDLGASAEPTGLSQAGPQERPVPSGFDPSRDAMQVLLDLSKEFGGSWTSNGVACILVHKSLPEHFGREEWNDWTFRPAPAAFDWAHNRGLIVPWKLSPKWVFTPLGEETARYAQFLCDSDGSPEGGDGEAGSVHDSAGPKDIARDVRP